MMNGLSRLVLFVAGLYGIYRYRYRIMNRVLGNPAVRKTFIRMSMSIPFVRNKMMSQAFR
ncbi:hypothetical protein [Litchfieldia salsa]|uniref:Uncharacterized protein n=1 Tax=Litchfieldia salsa TaxID=930152 RepID=A0A1H0VC99_9BACI|nr:hypothetical protein [Litchfieldia salsa]SDP75964.1 hypothetical protein SAMN05216565_106175 [Litchfieldia salsa]